MGSKRRSRRMAAALSLLGAAIGALVLSAGDPADELKAVAVLSFLRYSDWPPTADGALTVGVLGRPAFAEILSRTLSGRSVNGRPLRLTEVKADSDLRCCQLVYIATARAGDLHEALAGARAARALTIGESDHFLDAGGAVSLFFVDGHIGFEASLTALGQSGITVSSNLLRLGQIRDSTKGRPGK